MPHDYKKDQKEKKGKSEPKDQRKPKQSRHNNPPQDKKVCEMPSVHKAPEKPAAVEPSADFYKGLKRETDEILKITEENNAKYRNKEIKSNWEKYEMPIDSYDDVDEQENVGADYERLIQSSMSAGGHFQFKHEKSWDSVATATEYDKFFNIYIDDLAIAVCTIPFYERIGMDLSKFSEMDLITMNSRATKYKQKYYNDKSFTTPELEISNIISNICLTGAKDNINKINDTSHGVTDLDFKPNTIPELFLEKVDDNDRPSSNKKLPLEIDETRQAEKTTIEPKTDNEGNDSKTKVHKNADNHKGSAAATAPTEVNKSTEAPEDLEKWLDDFLDG